MWLSDPAVAILRAVELGTGASRGVVLDAILESHTIDALVALVNTRILRDREAEEGWSRAQR